MPQVINTNISSLNAQRNLNSTQSSLATSLQRLSTGLRINSAKDDAAGLAISERFTAQIRGLNQAGRNANDGISFAQTTESALGQTTEALQRIRELAVQAANGTNSASDRASLQEEVNQMIAEVDRIANQTQFNGQNVLDGSQATLSFHIGANANQNITVTGVDARASILGSNATVSSTAVTLAASAAAGGYTSPSGVLTINSQAITTVSDGVSSTDADASAKAVAQGINDAAGTTGVTAIVNATTISLGSITADANGLAAGEFTINGVNITLGAIVSGDSDSALQDAINAVQNQTGVTAALDGSSNLVLTASDGRNIALGADGANLVDVFGDANADITGAVDEVIVGTVTLDSDAAFVVDAGLAAATHGMTITAGTYSVTTTNAVENADVTSITNANLVITNMDRALDSVNSLRSTFGAVQSRFESVISSLSSASENLSAARSRIRDADFAAETANLTRAQILQQAGTAMLAQANALPQNVLSLLG